MAINIRQGFHRVRILTQAIFAFGCAWYAFLDWFDLGERWHVLELARTLVVLMLGLAFIQLISFSIAWLWNGFTAPSEAARKLNWREGLHRAKPHLKSAMWRTIALLLPIIFFFAYCLFVVLFREKFELDYIEWRWFKFAAILVIVGVVSFVYTFITGAYIGDDIEQAKRDLSANPPALSLARERQQTPWDR